MKGSILAALSVCLVLAGAGFSSAAPSKADLGIADMSPLTIKGHHFKTRERVTVIAMSDGVHVKRVRVSRAGDFTTTFPSVLLDRCSRASIRAVGSLGSRAVARIPRLACMPATQPR